MFATTLIPLIASFLGSGPISDSYCRELADQVQKTLRSATSLSFEATVEQGGLHRGGLPAVFHEVIHSRVQMRPRMVRTEVFRPGDKTPVVTFVDDGKIIHEWSDTELAEIPSVAPTDTCEWYVGLDKVDGCLFGGWMCSDIGDFPKYHDLFIRRMRNGRYIGMDSVDGRPCHVVLYEEPRLGNSVWREAFYIDASTHFMVRRKATQATHDETGKLLGDITRIQTLRNVSTAEIPDAAFVADPPASARKIEVVSEPSDAGAESAADGSGNLRKP